MKRIGSAAISLLLIFALLLSPASAAGSFATAAIDSFTLSADSALTNPVQTSSATAITALQKLLAAAAVQTGSPASAETLATIQVAQGSGTTTYQLLRDSGRAYYLASGSQYGKISYDDFNYVVNTIGSPAVYKYATPPTAKVGSTDVAPSAGTYRYRRISGNSSTINVAQAPAAHTASTTENALLLPSSFSLEPNTLKVTVFDSAGSQLWEGTREAAKSYKLPSPGKYSVQILATYSKDLCSGNLTYTYSLSYTDGVALSVEGANTNPGEVVVLRAVGVPAGADIQVSTDINFTPKFFDHPDGGRVALLPVSYYTSVGDHYINLTYGGVTEKFTIRANDKEWQIQNLDVDETTTQETIDNQKANAEYEQVIAPLRTVSDSQKYWSGRFILPVSDERVTTQFGMIRYVNGAPTSSRHGALDLARPAGTPVAATGSGQVLYAGYLQLTGNTILIEHGYGLKSWYYHMNSTNVKTGDMVQQGDIIGAVGSTGFSTGPHLHFGMSVNNVFINPYTAINTDLLS